MAFPQHNPLKKRKKKGRLFIFVSTTPTSTLISSTICEAGELVLVVSSLEVLLVKPIF